MTVNQFDGVQPRLQRFKAHLVPFKELKLVATAAQSARKTDKTSNVGGLVQTSALQWSEGKQKIGKSMTLTRGQLIACWWARALSPLTSQVAAGKETASVATLLDQVLYANKMVLDGSGRVGHPC